VNSHLWFALPLRVVNPLNTREHWAKRAKRTAAQRAAVTLQLKLGPIRPPPLPLAVTFTRLAPRPFDDDGLAAAFKGMRDAVAAFYDCDDGPKETRLRWRYEQKRGEPRQYAVEVRLEPQHE
jgi:hypothetical protein